MLSHLRFHRRAPSNPTSPVPDQLSPWDHAEHPQIVQDISSRPDFLPRPSNATNTPPAHGNRVTSSDPDTASSKKDPKLHNATVSPSTRSPSNGDSGFMGGLAFEHFRRAFESTRSESVENPPAGMPETSALKTRPSPPPLNTSFHPHRPPPVPTKQVKHATSFITPTDTQNMAGAFGKRPAGTRLASEPHMKDSYQQSSEPQKGKKGLPFLKNPMSTLLLRRKASQNAPDLDALSLRHKDEEPTYDPRIRGTRVHDFSAPRPRRAPTTGAKAPDSAPNPEIVGDISHRNTVSSQRDLLGRTTTTKSGGFVSDSTQTATSDADPHRPAGLSKASTGQSRRRESKRISLEDKPLPAKPSPSPSPTPTPSPPEENDVPSARTMSTKSKTVSMDELSAIAKSNPSTRTNRSHKISFSEGSVQDGVVSALPKHMKSTSSRFSFDMIGAARAEKLLEERHRQKELERQANNPVPTNRDSRFDDFDEDSFEYDAMLDDPGLEEAIPGVNADYEEEDDYWKEDEYWNDTTMPGEQVEAPEEYDDENDPDNDQENFAGFVFQRSNPQSSMASPSTVGMVATPRDINGYRIGFAVTKDATPDLHSATLPGEVVAQEELAKQPADAYPVAGLGIQAPEATQTTQYDPTVFQERRHISFEGDPGPTNQQDKDLYFDEGLIDELDFESREHQRSNFDESIFDANDTDEFGRPIPGAFAQAQAMRAAQTQEQKKRESDMTSRLSAQSAVSASTAHTSVSLGLQQQHPLEKEIEASTATAARQPSPPMIPPSQLTAQDKVAAYQAALADAAQKAAASGKFRRDSSPPLPTDLTITPPTTGSQPSSGGHKMDTVFNDNDYEDDGFGGDYGEDDFDDFDFEDEAIIAEANAEALAYDSDGFYGQEFGFYSTPISQSHHPPSGSTHGSNKASVFEYANGGYFGPSGVNRTTSGRVVSREPNLTPITERSEYSNRNSIMSLALPGGTFSSDGRNSGSLQSPGLAQLAMLADDKDITLSSLMRLRNKAWGGSQASLSSSKDGSPRSERAPPGERLDGTTSPAAWERSAHPGAGGVHARVNSAFSIWSNSDAGGSGTGSPTLTMSTAPPNPPSAATSTNVNVMPSAPLFSPPPPPIPQPSPGPQCPPVIEDEESEEIGKGGGVLLVDTTGNGNMSKLDGAMRSAAEAGPADDRPLIDSPTIPPEPTESPPAPPNTSVSSPTKRPDMGHRHKGSADSISYTKEEESGETRWVMERRRTAESGEVEILGREVLKGGRI